MDFDQLIRAISLYALPVLLAITLHEAAHGYTAKHFGDNTAYVMGRVTLNPLPHIDMVGTILIPALMLFSTFAIPGGPFVLGYAKPVPVRFGKLRNPKRDMIWVALAGPASNFFQALVWGALLILFVGTGVNESFLIKMADGGLRFNIVMFVFNLFPLPPLDGGRILVGLLPYRQAMMVSRIEPWGFFIVMALLIAGVVSALWMQPLMNLSFHIIALLLSPLSFIFGG